MKEYLEMVSLDRWKRSAVFRMLFPVATWYRKMASCSVVVIHRRLIKPPFCTSSLSRRRKTLAETAKLWRMRSGCPLSNSNTQPLPESLDVWYGSGWRRRHNETYPAEATTVDITAAKTRRRFGAVALDRPLVCALELLRRVICV